MAEEEEGFSDPERGDKHSDSSSDSDSEDDAPILLKRSTASSSQRGGPRGGSFISRMWSSKSPNSSASTPTASPPVSPGGTESDKKPRLKHVRSQSALPVSLSTGSSTPGEKKKGSLFSLKKSPTPLAKEPKPVKVKKKKEGEEDQASEDTNTTETTADSSSSPTGAADSSLGSISETHPARTQSVPAKKHHIYRVGDLQKKAEKELLTKHMEEERLAHEGQPTVSETGLSLSLSLSLSLFI